MKYMAVMSSRERLLTVIEHKVPDRVPVSTYELVGYNSKAWENNDTSYKRLMDVIREKTDCVVMWDPNSTQRLACSAYKPNIKTERTREDNAWITKSVLETPAGILTQITKRIDNVHTNWVTEHWCKTPEDVDKMLALPYEPVTYNFTDFQRVKTELGDHGIVMPSLADPMVIAAQLMEFGEFTLWAMMETAHFEKCVKILHERVMQNLKNMLSVGVADLYRICGPEYATPPYLPPAMFDRFVVPYVREMTELVHSKGGKVRVHSHGKIGKVLDMIVATGADAIDPCEAPPDGDIELADLKKRAGDKLCIFGNIQLKFLEQCNTTEIVEIVKKCMDSAKAGGGYVIMPTAAPINSPLAKKAEENYITFINTALELGKY
ncbi:MAG: uroporphyrinogen decarboxylase family protein [Elusimicrobiota bacterium]